ncbi:MAG: DUF1460 domain-containing protein [Rhodothermales bacterium]|nr:DUF1460 domain-containing protein [Rhodothermales bacterium]
MRTWTLLFTAALVLLLGCRAEEEAAPAVPARPAALEAPTAPPDSASQRLFEEVMAKARRANLHERPLGEIMQAVGLEFLGTPYAAGTLDEPEQETLIASLTGFDCVLFIETALALARGIAAQDYSYETFLGHIQDQRYRRGAMNGYCSRLHYFSDWIADNERRGNVRNITGEIGGEVLDKQLTFMSEHRDAYPRFAENDSLFQGIQAMEDSLRTLTLYYVPQDRIGTVYDDLRAGDIIATATDIDGLDVTHSGLVYKGEDGSTGFLHASTTGGVKVSPDLQDYVMNNKRQIGIVVARPVAAR